MDEDVPVNSLSKCAASVPPVVEAIVSQHVDEVSFLCSQRSAAVRAPNFSLRELSALDDRISAHLDGLRVAAESGWRGDHVVASDPESGALFAATLLVLEASDRQRLERLLTLAEEAPARRDGLIAAFGWISAGFLQGVVKHLLVHPSPFARSVGIACCAMHG